MGVTFDESLGESLRVTVIATGINTEADLPDKVTTMARPRETVAQPLPFTNKDKKADASRQGNGNRLRNPFLDVGLDEDKLDTPTFIRRNEN